MGIKLGLGMLAAWGLAVVQSDDLKDVVSLRREIREKREEAVRLVRAAHEALDRADYEQAVGRHRKAVALQAEVEGARKRLADRVAEIARAKVAELDHDDFQVRERASAVILGLGVPALRVIEEWKHHPSAEVRARVQEILPKLSEVDELGVMRQWATSAKASSEYSNPDWAASQATGKPDTFQAGDARTAWATVEADGGEEWLEVGYDRAVRPATVRIHETFNPGAVTKVEARDGEGKWRTLWEGKDPVATAPGWFEVQVAAADWSTRLIRIRIDTRLVAGWNEIDAVELVGELAP